MAHGLLIDLTGHKFGRFTVLERSERKPGTSTHATYWKCRCECGQIRIVNSNALRKGHSKSCGCLRNDLLSVRMKDWHRARRNQHDSTIKHELAESGIM